MLAQTAKSSHTLSPCEVLDMSIKPMLSTKNLTPLLEVIIAVAFFSASAVVLAQVFASAHISSTLAHDINNATLYVRQCAEQIHLMDFDDTTVSIFLDGFEKGSAENTYIAFLDEDFSKTTEATAYTTVVFEFDTDENTVGFLLSGQFTCTRKDNVELIRIDAAAFYEFSEIR